MLKHEMAEIALIEPPEELKGLAITIMDGPFFSTMPYPSTDLYSLTHVQYTPHFSFLDGDINPLHKEYLDIKAIKTKAPYMIASAARYLPCMARAKWKESNYEIKTVLLANENDDGRPILYHRNSTANLIPFGLMITLQQMCNQLLPHLLFHMISMRIAVNQCRRR